MFETVILFCYEVDNMSYVSDDCQVFFIDVCEVFSVVVLRCFCTCLNLS